MVLTIDTLRCEIICPDNRYRELSEKGVVRPTMKQLIQRDFSLEFSKVAK
jgi:hypothetical protein